MNQQKLEHAMRAIVVVLDQAKSSGGGSIARAERSDALAALLVIDGLARGTLREIDEGRKAR